MGSAFKNVVKHVEIEFLKSLSYEKINEIMNDFKDRINAKDEMLKNVLEAWYYESNQGDGIMEEHISLFEDAENQIKQNYGYDS